MLDSFTAGLAAGLASGRRLFCVQEKVDIATLAAVFDAITAEAQIGETGFSGGTETAVGTSVIDMMLTGNHLTAQVEMPAEETEETDG